MASGAALIGIALIVSNAAIERALLGASSGSLRWGPTALRSLLLLQGVALALAGKRLRGTPLPPAPPGATATRPARIERGVWALLAGMTVVALALRLWHLNSCLWFDEVLTVVNFVRAPLGRIVTTFPSQNQHMLYSVLAHVAATAFGESAWSVRLPSVLFGVASVWALFLLGRHVLDARAALLACALATVSYHHVWFSQNARGYMGLMFFATLATWLWLEALARNTWACWVSYAVALALGLWTHLTMLFVPAAHLLLLGAALLRRWLAGTFDPDGLSRPLVAWLLAASIAVELYAPSLPQFLGSALHEVSLPSEWTNPLWVVTESWRSLSIGFGKGAAAVLGLLLASVGWLAIARRDWMAAGSMVLPALLGGAAMLGLGHNLWPRFFFFSVGFALLIIVYGALTLPRLLAARLGRSELGDGLGVTLAGLMIVASILSLPHVYALPKQDFVGARDYVEQQRRPGDAVVAVGLAGVAFRRYFAPQWSTAESGEDLDAMRRGHGRMWLVYTLPIELKAYRPAVWDAIQRDFEIVKVFPGTLGDGEVNVCRERGARGDE